uniref:BTB/POZ domain-containing protein At3g56230-like n=1 Tax=Erigeron canadensis TaxID=72917 RepID=UPI001CB96C17|nr:BTB/POZ domain-containing protein At3g56230-like [Erigeron canadensis]
MDCSICSAMPYNLRPPRNTICVACYEGAKSIIAMTNKTDDHKISGKFSSDPSVPNSSKGFMSSLKWLKEMKKLEEESNQKLAFLSGFNAAFIDQIHTDILIKPGDDAPSIPAHRALLATRSSIFRNMLDSDGCKAAPNDTISLLELSHDEVEALLEFLYSGDLVKEKLDKHLYSLSIAADKYEITFLQKYCENRMLEILNANNALDILEVSDTTCNRNLKETALSFVVKNMEDIVFASRFDVFALKNPHLTVQITRASFMEIKNRRSDL